MVFLQVAISAIGIAIVLMVGYLVVAQVQAAIPETAAVNVSAELGSTTEIVYAGFALIAVGVIVLAAFGLISVFQ